MIFMLCSLGKNLGLFKIHIKFVQGENEKFESIKPPNYQ